jgi:drug/metabolite transporter (DMT)-like permease
MRIAFEAGLGAATVSVIGVARHSRAWFGVTVAIVAGAAFAVANTSAGVAYQGGSNPLTVASTRFLLPTAALVAWLGVTRISLVLPKRQAIVAILLGVVTALYNWALLRSFNSIPFALAVLIIYLYPLIAAVIVAGFGWDKFAWRIGSAIAVAFIGLALALDVRGSHLETSGVILAFLAAVGLAIVVAVSSRVFGNGDARPVTLYMSAVASVLLLLLCAVNGDFALPQTNAGWIGFGAAAVFYGFAIITFFIAISMIGPVRASLFSYSDAVISAVLGVVVLGQALTMIQVAGIALVIIALISATVRRNKA